MYSFIADRIWDVHKMILSPYEQGEMRADIQNEENSVTKALRVKRRILCYKTLRDQPGWGVGLGYNE